MQDILDQVSNLCDNNQSDQDQVYDNRYQTETPVVTFTARSRSKGAKIDQVSEHRRLDITIDNKIRWDLHTNNVCKTVSRRVPFYRN